MARSQKNKRLLFGHNRLNFIEKLFAFGGIERACLSLHQFVNSGFPIGGGFFLLGMPPMRQPVAGQNVDVRIRGGVAADDCQQPGFVTHAVVDGAEQRAGFHCRQIDLDAQLGQVAWIIALIFCRNTLPALVSKVNVTGRPAASKSSSSFCRRNPASANRVFARAKS